MLIVLYDILFNLVNNWVSFWHLIFQMKLQISIEKTHSEYYSTREYSFNYDCTCKGVCDKEVVTSSSTIDWSIMF